MHPQSWFQNTLLQLKKPRVFGEMVDSMTREEQEAAESGISSEEVLKKKKMIEACPKYIGCQLEGAPNGDIWGQYG